MFAEVLQALANPVRLKMLVLIAVRPRYTYELSKPLELSYPLTHLHVTTLEKAGLVRSEIVPSPRPKKVYRLADFRVEVSPEALKEIGEELEGSSVLVLALPLFLAFSFLVPSIHRSMGPLLNAEKAAVFGFCPSIYCSGNVCRR